MSAHAVPDCFRRHPLKTFYNGKFEPTLHRNLFGADAYLVEPEKHGDYLDGPFESFKNLGPKFSLTAAENYKNDPYHHTTLDKDFLTKTNVSAIRQVAQGEKSATCLYKDKSPSIERIEEWEGHLMGIVRYKHYRKIEHGKKISFGPWAKVMKQPFEKSEKDTEFLGTGEIIMGNCEYWWVPLTMLDESSMELLAVFMLNIDIAAACLFDQKVESTKAKLKEAAPNDSITKNRMMYLHKKVFSKDEHSELKNDFENILDLAGQEMLKLSYIGRDFENGELILTFSEVVVHEDNDYTWMVMEWLVFCNPCDLKYGAVIRGAFPVQPQSDGPLMLMENKETEEVEGWTFRSCLDTRLYPWSKKFKFVKTGEKDRHGRDKWLPIEVKQLEDKKKPAASVQKKDSKGTGKKRRKKETNETITLDDEIIVLE